MKLFSKATRKKITALVLAAGVMVMGFAGCGKKEEKKDTLSSDLDYNR